MQITPATRVSVVLPAYRLASTIAANIDRVVKALGGVEAFEVVVVDDGSDDATRENAEEAAKRHPEVTVIANPENAGKGRATQRGVAATSGEIIVFLDGDLDLPPEQVPSLLDSFIELDADAMVGSKRASMRQGGYPLLRRFLSRAFSLVAKVLFRLPVDETQTGLKVFKREPLLRWLKEVEVDRYAYDLELLVLMQRAGCRIIETPVALDVSNSTSSVTLGTLWEMARDTVSVWIRTRRRN